MFGIRVWPTSELAGTVNFGRYVVAVPPTVAVPTVALEEGVADAVSPSPPTEEELGFDCA